MRGRSMLAVLLVLVSAGALWLARPPNTGDRQGRERHPATASSIRQDEDDAVSTPSVNDKLLERTPASPRLYLESVRRSDAPVGNHWITGRVSDESGKPIVEASVRFRSGPTGATSESVLTDQKGEYQLNLQDEAEVRVEVSCRGYGRRVRKVTIGLEPVTRANFVMLPGRYKLTGRVIDTFSELPIEDAEITIDEKQLPLAQASETAWTLKTDHLGKFAINDIVGDPVGVTASADGYFEELTQCKFEAGCREVLFRLVPAPIIDFQVVDRRGAAIAGARVERPDGLWVSTDTDGRFTVPVIDELSRIHLTVTAAGYLSRELLMPVESPTAEIVLYEGPLVRGRVTASGRRVASARVELFSSADPLNHQGTVRSDAAGRFAMRVSEKELSRISVTAQGYPTRSFDLQGTDTGAEIHVDLMPGTSTIHGRFIDGNGAPFEDFVVLLANHESREALFQRVQNPAGMFRLPGLQEGVYLLQASLRVDPRESQPAGRQSMTRIELGAGETVRVELIAGSVDRSVFSGGSPRQD